MSVRYMDEFFSKFEIIRKPPARHYGRNQDGYGRKISSDFMVMVCDWKQKYRVYITQISNAGSAWCIIGCHKFHFRDCDFLGM